LGRKALAGLGDVTLTAGGEFHPALRTRPPGMSGLEPIMANGGRASKNPGHRNRHVSHHRSACPGGAPEVEMLTIGLA
jgi:hypothetical protein